MQLFDDQVIGGLLESSLETASIDEQGWHDHGAGPGSREGRYIEWHSFTDLNASVVADVARIRAHPPVPGRIPIHGFVYDVRSGRLPDVPGAKEAGAARG